VETGIGDIHTAMLATLPPVRAAALYLHPAGAQPTDVVPAHPDIPDIPGVLDGQARAAGARRQPLEKPLAVRALVSA